MSVRLISSPAAFFRHPVGPAGCPGDAATNGMWFHCQLSSFCGSGEGSLAYTGLSSTDELKTRGVPWSGGGPERWGLNHRTSEGLRLSLGVQGHLEEVQKMAQGCANTPSSKSHGFSHHLLTVPCLSSTVCLHPAARASRVSGASSACPSSARSPQCFLYKTPSL